MRAPEFWRTGAGPWPRILAPLGGLYGLAGRLERALLRPRRAAIPVLCVGNLTAGGTGKTPVAIALGRAVVASGRAVHFLSRGYGGRARGPLRVDPARHDAAEVGDEALLLAREGPTWIARDRVAGAEAARAAGAQALVLDDGFQDPALAKDLSLVVIDGGAGFGNGRLIPAGPLREPVARGLARARAAVIVGEDATGAAGDVHTAAPGLPLLACRLAPAGGAAALAGRRVFAFAGIGRPAKFGETLAEIGAEIAGLRPFPDHHPYSADDVAEILAAAEALDAAPVTTAKDYVRLPSEARGKVVVLEVEARFADTSALARLIESVIPPSAGPAAPGRGA